MIKKVLLSSLATFAIAGAEWGYSGDISDKFWGDLHKSYETCKTGKKQSPIDISKIYKANLRDIFFKYRDTVLDSSTIVDNGHTIKVNYNEESYIIFQNRKYYLKQFHFHSSSEHTVDSISYPLEVHFVHMAKNGSLAVVGVLFKEGEKNEALAKVLDTLDTNSFFDLLKMPIATSSSVNAREFLPKSFDYYTYRGSLTTPPCSEGVRWIVMKEKVEASKEQIAQFNRYYKGNNRAIQELNKRRVREKK